MTDCRARWLSVGGLRRAKERYSVLEYWHGSQLVSTGVALGFDHNRRGRTPRWRWHLLLALILSIGLVPPSAEAKWSRPRKLVAGTADGGTRRPEARIAVSGDTVHVVWREIVSINRAHTIVRRRLVHMRSLDCGQTWGAPTVLAQGRINIVLGHVGLTAAGEDVAVLWTEQRPRHCPVCYRAFIVRSEDGGATFDRPRRLTAAKRFELTASIATRGDYVAVGLVKLGTKRVLRAESLSNAVAVSADRGRTWREHRVAPGLGVKAEVVLGRPQHAGVPRLFAVGKNSSDQPFPSYRVSDDLGRTWSPLLQGNAIPEPSEKRLKSAAELNGSLHFLSIRGGGLEDDDDVVYESVVDGAFRPSEQVLNPDDISAEETVVFDAELVAGDGGLFALWGEMTRNTRHGRALVLAISRDRGATWSRPKTLARGADSGALGVSDANAGICAGTRHVVYTKKTRPRRTQRTKQKNRDLYYRRKPAGFSERGN